jgi:hypothetical protein
MDYVATKRDRSCEECGFFVLNETEETLGYCLINDSEIEGKQFEILDGEEHDTATKECCLYRKRIPFRSQIDFLNWRSAILRLQHEDKVTQTQDKIMQAQNKMTKIITILTGVLIVLAVIQIYIACIALK